MKLVIGNKNYSSWSLRVWLFMRHADLDFEEVQLSLGAEDWPEQIARYSPAGKVPVLVDEDRVIWDSLAICETIAEAHDIGWPSDPNARATARAVAAEMHSGFQPLRMALPMNCRARGKSVDLSVEVQKDIDRVFNIWVGSRRHYGDTGPWLFGDFTIADAMFAPVVLRFETYGIEGPRNAAEYRRTVLNDPFVQDWIRSAERESETITKYEVA